MVRPDLVDYLKQNLKKFSADDLRRQLAQEGVSDVDFNDNLRAAQGARQLERRSKKIRLLLFLILALLGGGAALFFMNGGQPPSSEAPVEVSPALGEAKSVFIGRYGYVVHLPPGYTYLRRFEDPGKTVEVVYFCKVGTHLADLMDQSLYGELDIMRLEAKPSPLTQQLNGAEILAETVTGPLRQSGQEFTLTRLQIASLRGFQLNYMPPAAHIEAYLLGQKTLFFFYAGQDDEIYRAILTSLRDEASEG